MLAAIGAADLWLLSVTTAHLGWLVTVSFAVLAAVLGAWLIRTEGFGALLDSLSPRCGPNNTKTNYERAVMLIAGGILLIIPGYLSDVIGLLCALRWTRPTMARIVGFLIGQPRFGRTTTRIHRQPIRGEILEGKVIEADAEP